MPVSEEIGRIIMDGGNVLDIKEQAAREGVWGLRQAALHKVKQGITSLEEINRVTVGLRQRARSSHGRSSLQASSSPSSGKARTRKGNRVKGRGLAKDELEMRADLRRQGIAATRVRKERQLFKSEGKVTAEDIAIFAASSRPCSPPASRMVQAFEIIGVGHDKPAMQKLMLGIKSDIETGNALNEALAKHPLYFDDLFVNLVEAGEHAGALETVLDKIATYKEKTEALKKKIKKALFYPAAVLVVAVIVTVILLIFVIPQFETPVQGLRRGPAGVHAVRDQHVALDAGQGLDPADPAGRRGLRLRSTSTSARAPCASSSTACR